MNLTFEQVDLGRHRDVLTRFNVAYLDWAAAEVEKRFALSLAGLLGTTIPAYVDGALDKLCAGTPPTGVFYLALDGDTAVGMGGLRQVSEGVAEIKRIYVSEAARGGGVGAKVLDRLVQDARAFGYRELVLDTGPFMTSAHRLYEAAGFFDVPPYPGAEVPEALHHDWRFMRCRLS
ncbi:GNAT family N-acetyltransferase [Maricaulis sp.]|uniref:GNAT family N-acetyltransferase n=1 Tax=Maricaulis sp. TaxID=1486257 RepID=UPI003A8CA779